ncbi:MAG: molecular chaperone TorD family protein [Candidatus Thiodiazotropha sp. (ex Monitilora ramsayi)]|nr:molecular chaperone TorD family protein [Candidatus Thiodiazotropha sp. (ex Monitilora ramsayi)]
METDWKKLADIARSRATIYGLLTAVFREVPTEALIEELRGPRFSGALSEMGMDLGDDFYVAPTSTIVDQMTVEFTRLFIGPGQHISAHESIFVDLDGGRGGLWGPKTVEVKKFIETTGLEYATQYTGLPDHVSVELEFMQRLASLEAEKWGRGDRQGAEYCLSVQRLFLEQHLLSWLPVFCDQVILQAELPFYLAMAELTKDYMTFERQRSLTVTAA